MCLIIGAETSQTMQPRVSQNSSTIQVAIDSSNITDSCFVKTIPDSGNGTGTAPKQEVGELNIIVNPKEASDATITIVQKK